MSRKKPLFFVFVFYEFIKRGFFLFLRQSQRLREDFALAVKDLLLIVLTFTQSESRYFLCGARRSITPSLLSAKSAATQNAKSGKRYTI